MKTICSAANQTQRQLAYEATSVWIGSAAAAYAQEFASELVSEIRSHEITFSGVLGNGMRVRQGGRGDSVTRRRPRQAGCGDILDSNGVKTTGLSPSEPALEAWEGASSGDATLSVSPRPRKGPIRPPPRGGIVPREAPEAVHGERVHL